VLLSRRRATAGAVVAAIAFAAPLSAQIARLQKAHLELAAPMLQVTPGADARFEVTLVVDPGWHVQAHVPTYDYLIPTVLSLEPPAGFAEPAIDYPAPIRYKFEFADEELDVYEGRVAIGVALPIPAGMSGERVVPLKVRYQACDDRQCLPPVDTTASLTLTSAGGAEQPVAAPRVDAGAPIRPAPRDGRSLTAVLLLALLGGFILNGMPCVLPILSLKLFSLVKSSGRTRAAVRTGALATAAGILVSFWGLAAAALLARRAGAAIGWGIQFQQPGFVAFLAVVILLFTLNLWGLFEIPLPARLARLADSGSAREGLPGHFVSGLFATLMATPCSAPFLGTALSFALGQPAGTIVAALTAVGVGLALPYLLLVVAPGAVRLLPRPGAWMDTLRGAMGFLLAGALVWLLYVLSAQIRAEEIAFFELALLALALAVWWTQRARAQSIGRRIGWAVTLVLALAAIGLAARAPRSHSIRTATASGDADTIGWVPYDPSKAAALVRDGRLVFLDITADWCVTCKVNERVILHTPDVVAAFRRNNVVAMKADWTNRNDDIARFLAEHGRYGIPFYMLWRPGQEPHVFGELISKQNVIDVIDAAGAGRPSAAAGSR